MKTNFVKTAVAAIAMMSLASSLGFADGFGGDHSEDRGRGDCERAQEDLNQAQASFNRAQAMVNANSSYCPGGWNTNAACMMTIANNYNQAQTNLQNAQQEYYRDCRRR